MPTTIDVLFLTSMYTSVMLEVTMKTFPYEQTKVRKALLRMLLQALAEVVKDDNSPDAAIDEHDLMLLHQTLGVKASEDLIETQQ